MEALTWGTSALPCRDASRAPRSPWRRAAGTSISRLRLLGATAYFVPLDVLEEGVDVALGVRAVVDRVRVLVHIHDEQRRAPGETVRVVPQPVSVRGLLVRIEREDHPARPARVGEARLPELLPPCAHGAVRGPHSVCA